MREEEIIKQKRFIDLTAQEKELLKGYAETEAEFDEIKAFLTQMEHSSPHQLTTSKDTDDSVLAYLKAIPSGRPSRLQSFWLMLFPVEKSWYQSPALQLGLVAVIVIGFFVVSPFQKMSADQNLAKNEAVYSEKDIQTEMEEKQIGDALEKETSELDNLEENQSVEQSNIEMIMDETSPREEEEGDLEVVDFENESSTLKDKNESEQLEEGNRAKYQEFNGVNSSNSTTEGGASVEMTDKAFSNTSQVQAPVLAEEVTDLEEEVISYEVQESTNDEINIEEITSARSKSVNLDVKKTYKKEKETVSEHKSMAQTPELFRLYQVIE